MNPQRGEVAATIGGTKYVLRFTMHAVCAMEEELGIAIGQKPFNKNDPFRKGLRGYRTLLWAGLLHSNPEFTIEAASELFGKAVDAGRKEFPALIEALAKAYNEFFPEAEPQQKVNGQAKDTSEAKNALGAESVGENSGDKPPAVV